MVWERTAEKEEQILSKLRPEEAMISDGSRAWVKLKFGVGQTHG
jgi:hypothetical protein